MTAGILAALATGLVGSLGHCVGMCGPIAGAVGLAAGGTPRRAIGVQLAYGAGRVTTYGFVGFAMGLTGSFVNTAARLAGVQDAISVVAGALMVLFGLGALGLAAFARELEGRIASRVFRAARGVLAGGGPSRAFPLGLLLGLLPCGLSYSVFMASAASGHPVSGLAIALAFGAGTAPALVLAGSLAGAIGARLRGALYRAAGAAVVAFGVLFVLRGLGVHVAL